MSIAQESASVRAPVGTDDANPFADVPPAVRPTTMELDFTPWTDNESPFTDEDYAVGESEFSTALSTAFHELRDEGFDDAVAHLVAETERLVEDRFQSEGAVYGTERQRLAEAHLSPVGNAAEQYLDALNEGLAGLDVSSLGGTGLSEVLDGFDPVLSGQSPAGEDFLGSLVKKAKGAVSTAVNAAKKVGRKLGSAVVTAALRKLRALIRPLLTRVLAFAIDKLPMPLRGPARALAQRIKLESEESAGDGDFYVPAMGLDPLSLAESFDAALAAALFEAQYSADEPASFAEQISGADESSGGSELQVLAAARQELVEHIAQADDGEDLTPAIEQFVPVLLSALRVGIKLAGRKRVVDFLAHYVARLIGRWVGPQLSRPLSTAIVDTGLRLATLEQPNFRNPPTDLGPELLGATIEDTVRQLAMTEEHMFEDEDLMQLAVSVAFDSAVATNFPTVLVRPGLQQAPTLGGSFLPMLSRSAHPYRRYTRSPQIELAPQLANAVMTFGAVPLGTLLRAAGTALPQRFRVHIFEAMAGTSLARLARNEGQSPWLGFNMAVDDIHPLTSVVSGLLLQEPGLGTDVPDGYLGSRHRIAVGQRFFYLEPIEGMARLEGESGRVAAPTPSRRRISVNLARARVTGKFYVSETESQQIAAAIKQGHGVPALLKALVAGAVPAPSREAEEFEDEESGYTTGSLRNLAPNILRVLRRQIRAWCASAIADWARQRSGEFVRAASDPAEGVTVRVDLTAVPGLNLVRDARAGRLGPDALRGAFTGTAFRGTPTAVVTVIAGRIR